MRCSSHCVEFTGSSYFFQGKLSSLPGSFIFCGLPPPPFPISVPSLFLPVSSQLFKPHHLNLIKQFHWDIALGGAFIQLLAIAADARVCTSRVTPGQARAGPFFLVLLSFFSRRLLFSENISFWHSQWIQVRHRHEVWEQQL